MTVSQKLMSSEVLLQLLRRIEQHVTDHALIDFPVILHGGEPLLWGIDNFHGIAEATAKAYRHEPAARYPSR